MDLSLSQSLAYFVPELILSLTILGIFIGDLMIRQKEILGYIAFAGTLVALVVVALTGAYPDATLFHRMIVHDQFAVFFKLVLAASTLVAIFMSLGSRELRTNVGEYYGLLVASGLATFFMCTASNLLMAYLSLEFVSLTSYVLTGYLRQNRRSGEASLKYLIYGGVASGTMIYGLSWIFGLTGSMDYGAINNALNAGEVNSLALFIAVLLSLAGFGYKISAVPFHMWAPDVYTGAPIPVAAFLSVASKAAGFALLLRFFYPGMSVPLGGGQWGFIGGADWPALVLVISMITMTVGNLAALQQQNLKRLLAYSSIAHAGYILMGFVVLSDEGLRAVLFYIVTYYLMNIGAFLTVMVVVNSTGREDIDGLRGLAWRGGWLPAVAMAVFLFSLAGLPPLAGFIGKFYLFAAVINSKLYALALVGVINSVISLYYYARIVRTMFLDFPTGEEAEVKLDVPNGVVLGVLSVATIILGVYWAPVIEFAGRSVRFLMN